MDEPVWLSEGEQHAWRGLIAIVTQLPMVLGRQLQDSQPGVTNAYYQIIAMLSEAEGRALRMSALAQITATTPSRLSHAVARLEDRGWVRREPCPTDRRGQLAVLTDEGFAAVQALAPGHVAEVRRLVFDGLSPEQVDQLGAIASTISARVLEAAGPGGVSNADC